MAAWHREHSKLKLVALLAAISWCLHHATALANNATFLVGQRQQRDVEGISGHLRPHAEIGVHPLRYLSSAPELRQAGQIAEGSFAPGSKPGSAEKEDLRSHWSHAAVICILCLGLVGWPALAEEVSRAWFEPSPFQQMTSKSTAPAPSLEEAEVFLPPANTALPYTTIKDNTEGVAAFEDVLGLLPAPATERQRVLLDIGAGRSDVAKRFLERNCPGYIILTADPYNRSVAENAAAQQTVEQAGGADVVTSMSVLNVVKEPQARSAHLALVRKALKPGGLAIFKVWAGLWPERGSGVSSLDEVAGTYQANAWAAAFLPEVEEVFGKGNAFADNNLNLIVGRKAQ